MVVAAHESPKMIRPRDAALNARDAITNQYATSTEKETKTPSTKKFSVDVRPLPLRKAPRSAKRNLIVVSSDDENQHPRKRQIANTPAFQDNAPQQ